MAKISRLIARYRFFHLLLFCLLNWQIWGLEQLKTPPESGASGIPNEVPPEDSFSKVESSLYPVKSLGEIETLLSEQIEKAADKNGSAVMLLLVYNDKCKSCFDLSATLKEAWHSVSSTIDSRGLDHASPKFGKMDTSEIEPKVLNEMLGVNKVPSMVFIVTTPTIQSNGSKGLFTYVQDYAGRSITPRDIHDTVMHAWYSNVVARGGLTIIEEDHGRINPKRFQNTQECFEFLQAHSEHYIHETSVKPALPPTLTEEEFEYVDWLMDDEQGEDFVVFVQCRLLVENDKDPLPEMYKAYNLIVDSSPSIRNRLFFSVTECKVDGSVSAYLLNRNLFAQTSKMPLDHATRIEMVATPESTVRDLTTAMVRTLTPSLLWFDRQSTAPIAFPRYRKLHATLFVDLHNVPAKGENGEMPDSMIAQRNIVQQFRRICREHRQLNVDMERDLVCLVVPSIEHRVLSTFGIDIWSPLDAKAAKLTDDSESRVIPSLLITDGRSVAGLNRYLLEYEDLTASESAMEDFFDKFWDDELQPQIKSSSWDVDVVTNQAGVQILTSATAEATVAAPEAALHHSLIMFTTGTCGHCKRFAVVFDEVSELLRDIGWSAFIDLYRFDLDTDEIPVSWNLTVPWVPEVFYLPPANKTNEDVERAWRQYDWMDVVGDGIGRLSSPVEVIEWLIHTGDFTQDHLQSLLDGLEALE